MSHYTTEVRYICEYLAGLQESKGLTNVNEIIEAARPQIFDFDYPYYDAQTKEHLETSILKHFYVKEIGFETYALWKLHLESEMRLIMPKYVGLYRTLDMQYNPLNDVDLIREIDSTDTTSRTDTGVVRDEKDETISDVIDRNESTGNESQSTNTSNYTDTTHSEGSEANKFSDTPQGYLTNVDNLHYLTDYRKIDTENDGTDTGSKTDTGSASQAGTKEVDETKDRTIDSNNVKNSTFNRSGTLDKDFTEHTHGKSPRRTYQNLILEYRKTLLNIEALICNDLEDLFMQLW